MKKTKKLKNKPYCQGPNFTLIDRKMLCSFIRFCRAFQNAWQQSGTKTAEVPVVEPDYSEKRVLIIDNDTGLIVKDH